VAVREYRDLIAWQKAYALAIKCQKLSRVLPSTEQFGLSAQLRGAAVSIPANIAEGNGRRYRGDYIRHLRIAHGSLMELETHLQFARDLDYIPLEDAQSLLELSAEVGRILGGLLKSLEAISENGVRKRKG